MLHLLSFRLLPPYTCGYFCNIGETIGYSSKVQQKLLVISTSFYMSINCYSSDLYYNLGEVECDRTCKVCSGVAKVTTITAQITANAVYGRSTSISSVIKDVNRSKVGILYMWKIHKC